MAFALGARTGVFMVRMRSLRRTLSKAALYFLQVDRFGTDVCAPQRVDEASSSRVYLNFRPSLPRAATLKLEAG
jgi:hypothetical protein